MRLKAKPAGRRVRFHDRENAMAFHFVVVQQVFSERGHDPMLTSADDGVHSDQSSHYRQEATDWRVHGIPMDDRVAIVEDLRSRLGPDFGVLHEAVGSPNEHIHIQYKPRRS